MQERVTGFLDWFNSLGDFHWIFAGTIATVLVVYLDWFEEYWDPRVKVYTSFGMGWLLWFVIVIQAWLAAGRIEHRRSRLLLRVLVPMLLLIPLSMTLGVDDCPHAKYVLLGDQEFCISGIPCGNPRTKQTVWYLLFERLGWVEFKNDRGANMLGLVTIVLLGSAVLWIRRLRRRRSGARTLSAVASEFSWQ